MGNHSHANALRPQPRSATSTSLNKTFSPTAWTLLLTFATLAHLAAAPFTKVEESFGMQAVHDLLFLGPKDTKRFDHAMFPGVVPRTFLAPAAVAAVAALPVALLLRLGVIAKLAVGVFARATLALFSVAALSRLRGAVEVAFGRRASVFLALLSALQFHLPFYFSRTLPNTFATVVTTLALADWIDGRAPRRALVLLAAASAALRCDVLLLAGAVGLHVLLTATLPLLSAASASLAGGLGAALASVAFDSRFWGRGALSEEASRAFGWSSSRLVWPELLVLLFNAPGSSSSSSGSGKSAAAAAGVVSSASSHWGTSPWHWYLTSALPRALGAAGGLGLLLAVVFSSEEEKGRRRKKAESRAKVATVSARHAALVAAGFVALYSFLPHKELRFLMPVLPLFNVVAAVGLADAWGDGDDAEEQEAKKAKTKKKPKHRRGFSSLATLLLLRSLAVAALAATAATTGLSLAAASKNYPGGVALERLHAIEEGNSDFAEKLVHIDAAAAQQGVTRFGERGGSSSSSSPSWSYSKDEKVQTSELFETGFTHLVSERGSVPGFDLIEAVEGFSGVRLVVAGNGEKDKEELLRLSPSALLRALRAKSVPRLKLSTEPRIYLHRRRREAEES